MSTTNGRLPASVAATRQNTAASVEAPEVAPPELKAVPDVEVPDVEVPDVEVPDVEVLDVEVPDWAIPELIAPEGLPLVTALPLVPPTGWLATLPLEGRVEAAPMLPPVFEPAAAPALEPW